MDSPPPSPHFGSTPRICLICRDTISPMVRPCVTYSCAHVFHIDCAESVTFHLPAQIIMCPLCRYNAADIWRQTEAVPGTTWLMLDAEGNALTVNPRDPNITAFLLDANHITEGVSDGYSYKGWHHVSDRIQLCRIRRVSD